MSKEVPEERLKKLLSDIEREIDQGMYHSCSQIPNTIQLNQYPSSLKNKAKSLRKKCQNKGKGLFFAIPALITISIASSIAYIIV